MAKTTITMPPFGNILNASIQTVKKLVNSRSTGISATAFRKTLFDIIAIDESITEIKYLPPEFSDLGDEEIYSDNAYDKLEQLSLLCLSCIGLIVEDSFPINVRIGENFLDLVSFDSPVTPDNIGKLDPLGKILFWLMGKNFYDITMYHDTNDSYMADLSSYEQRSFADIRGWMTALYGEEGDTLINYLIDETNRKTSIFLNNYADVTLYNDLVKVTFEDILDKVMSLTPLQFEHLCLEVVKQTLLAESPTSIVETQHTGKTNDGGIDGMLIQSFENGDKHTYYIQAKLYNSDNKISNNQLRDFVGGYPPNKDIHHGIFMTTSDYTKPAIDYKEGLNTHSLLLINQLNLIELMTTHEIGVERFQTEIMVMNKEFFRKLKRY